MNDKILLQLMDALRGEPLSDRGALFSLTLIAWYKASLNPECPAELQMKNCQGIGAQDLLKKLHELSINLNDGAFINEDAGIGRMRQPVINDAISRCLSLGDSGLLKEFDPTDAATAFEANELVFPVEVCDLVVGLAGDIEGKTVYLPWESNGQLTGRILKQGARGMIETIRHSKLPQLVSSILSDGKNIEVAHNDLLRNPHYLENGKLKQFEETLALLPFGVNIQSDVFEHDLYNRFKEKTRSLTVLTVRHILAQTKGRAIITSINSLLFSTGPERNLREDLLINQQLEAVIAMPAGLLEVTAIPFTILIVNTEKKCETVRFVNADTPEFKMEISRTKAKLNNVEKLIETILTSEDSDFVKNVSTQDILKNDAQLQVSRYALGAKEQHVARMLASMECKSLEDIAELVKPSVNVTSETGIEISEVGAADLPDYGYISTARKTIMIDPKSGKNQSQFLQPNDIVLIIKGNLGKVGIVGHDAPAAGNGGWIAGQSAAVIRVNRNSGIDPRALFVLLRSELGKELVKTLASGAAIPFVQLRELKQLSIPIPTAEEVAKASRALMEEEELQKQITEL